MKVIKFYSETCSPCLALAEFISELDVDIEAVDVDEDMEYAIKHNVRAMPTMIKLNGDEEVDRIVGFDSGKRERVREFLDV